MDTENAGRNLEKAARCGEPSYVWRDGQERRLQMILEAAGERAQGVVLENGCGIGMYVEHLSPHVRKILGLELDFERAIQARQVCGELQNAHILSAIGEQLPFQTGTFDLILSHEVLEHVQDDRKAVVEMARVLRPGGRMVIFVPNRGYPFETHGIYWRGNYHFGNIPLVNYLPRCLRRRLAPHVRVYSYHDMEKLFTGLPVRFIHQKVIFGAYDNIIRRWPRLGKVLRKVLQGMERTPMQFLGLSHFWVAEKV